MNHCREPPHRGAGAPPRSTAPHAQQSSARSRPRGGSQCNDTRGSNGVAPYLARTQALPFLAALGEEDDGEEEEPEAWPQNDIVGRKLSSKPNVIQRERGVRVVLMAKGAICPAPLPMKYGLVLLFWRRTTILRTPNRIRRSVRPARSR